MVSKQVQRFTLVAAMFAMGALLSGCGSCKPGKPGPIGRYDIEVSLDQSLKDASVQVDLVGVNAASLARWEGQSMNKYWEANDPARKDADKVTLNFVSGKALTQGVDARNPKWDQWKAKGVTHVLVLADLPGNIVDKPGTQDARRQVLPLDECVWPKGTEKLAVLVKRSGTDVITPPRLAR